MDFVECKFCSHVFALSPWLLLVVGQDLQRPGRSVQTTGGKDGEVSQGHHFSPHQSSGVRQTSIQTQGMLFLAFFYAVSYLQWATMLNFL